MLFFSSCVRINLILFYVYCLMSIPFWTTLYLCLFVLSHYRWDIISAMNASFTNMSCISGPYLISQWHRICWMGICHAFEDLLSNLVEAKWWESCVQLHHTFVVPPNFAWEDLIFCPFHNLFLAKKHSMLQNLYRKFPEFIFPKKLCTSFLMLVSYP